MRNLLSANLNRLVRARIFWLCTVAMLCFTVAFMLLGIRLVRIENLDRDLDYYYFRLLPYFDFFLSVFIALFLGTEYSDGTVRNKLIIGHTRSEIYLANLVTCFAGSFAVFLAWAIGGLVGIPYFGLWSMGISGYFQCLAVGLLTVLALTAILTVIAQLIANKAYNAVTSILAAIFLLLLASYFYNALCEPETIMDGVTITAEGEVLFGDIIENPAYIGGTLRTVYEIMLQILPTAQQIWIADETVTQPVLMCAVSLAVIAVMTGIGLLCFRKKDLK